MGVFVTGINGQDELITAVASVNLATVVVVSATGAVLMPWAREVQVQKSPFYEQFL
eukprot:COSAG06_NODE_34_length_31045_cov_28.806469_21_plen_56_part_00